MSRTTIESDYEDDEEAVVPPPNKRMQLAGKIKGDPPRRPLMNINIGSKLSLGVGSVCTAPRIIKPFKVTKQQTD